jgi:hypothetical protein
MVITVATLSACAHTTPQHISPVIKSDSANIKKPARVPDEYLVKLAPHVDEAIIFEYYGRFGIKYLHELEDETFLLIVRDDPGPQEMEDLIYDESRIQAVQPNIISWTYR